MTDTGFDLDTGAHVEEGVVSCDDVGTAELGMSIESPGHLVSPFGPTWQIGTQLAWRAVMPAISPWSLPLKRRAEPQATVLSDVGLCSSEALGRVHPDHAARLRDAIGIRTETVHLDGATDGMVVRGAVALEWIGRNGRIVEVGGRSYRLAFCFNGASADPSYDAAVIDPRLDVAKEPASDDLGPYGFTAYRDLGPQGRRGYLEWIDGGRRNPDVPPAFPLLLLHSLECALVRDGRTSLAGDVRQELVSLMKLHADKVFRTSAGKLLALCNWLDSNYSPDPVYASAAANYADVIPHRTLHYLGWAAQKNRQLEADQALLLLLEQPNTRLEPAVAQNFRELHNFWGEAFPHHDAGAIMLPSSLPRLCLTYQPIHGDFARSYSSDFPDVSSLLVPPEYQSLFDQCVDSIAPLEGHPTGKPQPKLVNRALKDPECQEMPVRPDGPTWLEKQVPSTAPVKMRAAELLAALYDHAPMKAKNMVAVAHVKQLSRDLEEQGYAFEPDPRFNLPRFRPETRISVFRSDPFRDEDANEEFFLAQAALVLGVIGHLNYPMLDVVSIGEIESRLQFRYRFSETQVHRLDAVRSCIELVEERRQFLARWIALLARKKDRIDDLYKGFGIAFAGQRRKSQLTKFAHGLHLVAPGLVKTDRLLAAATALYDGAPGADSVEQGQSPTDLIVQLNETRDDAAAEGSAPVEVELPLPGLRPNDSFLVREILKRPRLPAEFAELARARTVSVEGASERINEWVIRNIGAAAFSDGELVRLTPLAAEWIHSLTGPS
jgi:hypothetical protein